ncbi:MAG: hypothetical protein FJZ09_01045 [Candidatus Omnitrophica bacterium]|nr:hypothetical protein [Candidatus Omnitrophota bacterium]
MKRTILISIIIFLALAGAAAVFTRPLITFIAEKQLKAVFTQSRVSIGRAVLKPLSELDFFDLEITRGETYDFKVKEIRIRFNPLSLIARRIREVSLNGLDIRIRTPKKSILEFGENFYLKSPGIFSVKSFKLSGLALDLKSKDVSLAGSASLGLDLAGLRLDNLDLKVDNLDAFGVHLERGSLVFPARDKSGSLYIPLAKYNKARIKEIKSSLILDQRGLFLDPLSAELLDGKVEGSIEFRADRQGEYLARLKFKGLDTAAFINDFELKEKVEATGKLSGTVELSGKGADLKVLSGQFAADEPGGMFVVKDTGFLEETARRSGQSLDILVESFKDYHYNMGTLQMGLEKKDLSFNLAMEGEKGKRNLTVVLHDFNLGKGE